MELYYWILIDKKGISSEFYGNIERMMNLKDKDTPIILGCKNFEDLREFREKLKELATGIRKELEGK